MARRPETRLARDGQFYSRAEFVDFYGKRRGQTRWAEAGRAPSAAAGSYCLADGDDSFKGFGGRRIHAVQIGLGTCATVVQNLVGGPAEWDPTVSWLLGATSERRPELFQGVAVEPVSEHVERLRKLAANLPQLRVVQAAIGEEDADGQEVHVLTEYAFRALLASVPKGPRRQRL